MGDGKMGEGMKGGEQRKTYSSIKNSFLKKTVLIKTIKSFFKRPPTGQQDGSVAKGNLMLKSNNFISVHSQDMHRGKRELSLLHCPLTSPYMPWHPCVHTHTNNRTNVFKKVSFHRWSDEKYSPSVS